MDQLLINFKGPNQQQQQHQQQQSIATIKSIKQTTTIFSNMNLVNYITIYHRFNKMPLYIFLYICILSASLSLTNCQMKTTNNKQSSINNNDNKQEAYHSSTMMIITDEDDNIQLEIPLSQQQATTTAVTSTIDEPALQNPATTTSSSTPSSSSTLSTIRLDCRNQQQQTEPKQQQITSKSLDSIGNKHRSTFNKQQLLQTSQLKAQLPISNNNANINSRQQRQFGRLVSDPQVASGSTSSATRSTQQNQVANGEQDAQQAQDFTLTHQQQQQQQQQHHPQTFNANSEISTKEHQLASQSNEPSSVNGALSVATSAISTTNSSLDQRQQTAAEQANGNATLDSPANIPAGTNPNANNDQQQQQQPTTTTSATTTTTTTTSTDLAAMQMQALATELASQSQSSDFGPTGLSLMSSQHSTLSNRMGEMSSNNNQQTNDAHNSVSNYQPISGSPSSISVITPILNPRPTSSIQVQSTQNALAGSSSTMVKPLYVLGTPLGERDYNHESSVLQMMQQQQQQQQQLRNRAPKITESSVANSVMMPSDQLNSTNILQEHANEQFANNNNNKKQSTQIAKMPMSNVQQQNDLQMNPIEQQQNATSASIALNSQFAGDRMSGPSLIYTDGQLTHSDSLPITTPPPSQPAVTPATQAASAGNNNSQLLVNQQPLAPRLFQSQATFNSNQLASSGSPTATSSTSTSSGGAAVVGNNPRRPSLPPPVNQANAASGFRSPMSPSGPLLATANNQANNNQQTTALIQPPLNTAPLLPTTQSQQQNPFTYQTSLPPYLGLQQQQQQMQYLNNGQLSYGAGQPRNPFGSQQAAQQIQMQLQAQQSQQQQQQAVLSQAVVPTSNQPSSAMSGSYSTRRPLNITRVEHISAECSNDLIRAVVVFNGTFKGIIYSSNYANDPTCLYINGTGSSRYEFSIRLNQCGTMNKMELHQPSTPGEARRRDQVMWNSLSIQYNPIIEQEWDEHFKVSCEYGSDFWKTVSFSPFNVVTNTGSPVVFTINPPQCQMDVLLGHGIGPKIAVDGPVTVGDPLTLLIHMKSEKAGYDILVKNCVAHNGGKQRMQLIDSNGCVVNERFISPFRGTYNDNDLRHVTLYAYLKAFRFTGSPVLYLECEIHMCQSACPPQMCYWRRLSKRSTNDFEYEYMSRNVSKSRSRSHDDNDDTADSNDADADDDDAMTPIISDSVNLFKALQVRQEPEPSSAKQRASRSKMRQFQQQDDQQYDVFAQDDQAQLVCYRYAEVFIFMLTIGGLMLLVCTIAIACCLRMRQVSAMARKQHQRYVQSSSPLSSPCSSSASPSISSMVLPYKMAHSTSHSTTTPSTGLTSNLLTPINNTPNSSAFQWIHNQQRDSTGKPKMPTPNRSLYAINNNNRTNIKQQQPYC